MSITRVCSKTEPYRGWYGSVIEEDETMPGQYRVAFDLSPHTPVWKIHEELQFDPPEPASPQPPPEPDAVNSPPHYTQGGIECIDALQAALTPEEYRGALKANVIKYLWRERHKGGVESLRKAAWYLNRLIKAETDHGQRPN